MICSSPRRSAYLRAPTPKTSPWALDAAEARIRQALPIARIIYLEPDIYRADAHLPGRRRYPARQPLASGANRERRPDPY
jgi:hypothetical protein